MKYLFIFIIIILTFSPNYLRSQTLEELNSRFNEYFIEKRYEQLYSEIQNQLELDMNNTFLRLWQTYLLLYKEDSLNSISFPLTNPDIKKYNFNIILENMQLLSSSGNLSEIELQLADKVQQNFNENFDTLRIKLDSPNLPGFYTAKVQLQFKAPMASLSILKQKRLQEINYHLSSLDSLYFNKYDPLDNSFYCEIIGFPILENFDDSYTVLLNNNDSTFFEYNIINKEVLYIPSEQYSNLKINLPSHFNLVMIDARYSIKHHKVDPSVIYFMKDGYHTFFASTSKRLEIELIKKHKWQEIGIYVGSLIAIAGWILTNSR